MKNPLLLPELEEVIRNNDKEYLKIFCKTLHPATAAEFLEGLSPQHIWEVLQCADPSRRAEIFSFLPLSLQLEVISVGKDEDIVEILENMKPDERVDLFKELDEELQERLYPLFERAKRLDIRRLISFEDHQVGAIMTTEYASIPKHLSVEGALEYIRKIAPSRETVYYIYVVDQEGHLVGFISLKDLVLAKPTAKIEDIMHTDVISVRADEDAAHAANIIDKYNFLALPVVDHTNKLVGLITVDDVMDYIRKEATEDFYNLGAAGEPIDYFNSNVFMLAKERIVWLVFLVFVGILSGFVIERHSQILKSVIALAFFIPLLSGSGGNAGSQVTTIVTRGLATGQFSTSDLFRILKKEVVVALIVGIILGILAGGRAILINHNFLLAITVATSMVATIVVAKVLGTVSPIFFAKIGIDPAVVSAPLISSIVDVISIYIYLTIAQRIFVYS